MIYELKKNTREISYEKKKDIKKGCTLEQNDQNPQIIEPFEDKEQALKILKSYKSDICKMSGGAGSYYLVTEYYVEENEYDEDGEWISGGNIWGFSEMPVLPE